MILNQPGQTFMLERSCFYIGQEIVANDESCYAGLPGVVTEIRDGEDKETGNPTVDVYCDFYLPENPFFPDALRTRFGVRVDDIQLDQTIMSPEMIEPKAGYQINPANMQLYVLTYHVDSDDEHDTYVLGVSHDIALLKAKLERQRQYNRYFTNSDGNAFSLDGFDVSEDDTDDCEYGWIAQNDATYINYSITPVPFILGTA